MNGTKLILASGSPRRREILRMAGYSFEVIASEAEELVSAASPGELVKLNAAIKARGVAALPRARGRFVIGADTVVCLDGEILGKPRDAADAKRMLKSLSGRRHEVLTGWCIVSPDGSEESGVCATNVKFRELSGEDIDSYVATGEPMDKAGAYGVQERGCTLVESVEGDFFNVVGLPISVIHKKLGEMGIKPSDILGQN